MANHIGKNKGKMYGICAYAEACWVWGTGAKSLVWSGRVGFPNPFSTAENGGRDLYRRPTEPSININP